MSPFAYLSLQEKIGLLNSIWAGPYEKGSGTHIG